MKKNMKLDKIFYFLKIVRGYNSNLNSQMTKKTQLGSPF